MEAVVVVVVALVILDVLALRFGAESRDGFGGDGSGRRPALATGTGASGGGSTMWSAYSVEQEAYLRHEENLRWAGRRALLREARRAAAGAGAGGERRRAPLHRRLLHRLGGRLVAWGVALQARTAAPATAGWR